ncbi:MAG: hypothetical protein NC110_06520 [Ruminococcus sp.]|nr:hypothetical protein [Ruminococcus sp.]
MPDIKNFTPQMKEHFNTLPPFVQETIMQSSAKIDTLEELESISTKITKAQKTD